MIADTGAPPTLGRRLSGLGRAARPTHWVKNLSCLAGLVFSGRLFQGRAVAMAALAVAGFSLASSAVYLFNDVCDRGFDRLSPAKRGRPVASGLVPVGWALAGSAALAAAAFGSSLRISPVCAGLMVAYLGLGVAYSVRLKHAVLLDVGAIAFGFVLRVLYGVYAVGVLPTAWVVLCMFFLALFLGFAKRRGELRAAGADDPGSRRPVLAKYRTDFLDQLLVMTASMAVLCYALYTATGRQGNATLVVTVPLVTYGMTRYLLLVTVRGGGEAPERLLVTDAPLVATALLWLGLCVAILYNDVHIFLE